MKLRHATFIAQGRMIEAPFGGGKIKMWREVNPGDIERALGKRCPAISDI